MTSRLRSVCCRGCIIRPPGGGLVFPRRRLTDTRVCTVRYATRRRRSPRAACCRRSPEDESSRSRSSDRGSCSRSRSTPAHNHWSVTTIIRFRFDDRSTGVRRAISLSLRFFYILYFHLPLNSRDENDAKRNLFSSVDCSWL